MACETLTGLSDVYVAHSFPASEAPDQQATGTECPKLYPGHAAPVTRGGGQQDKDDDFFSCGALQVAACSHSLLRTTLWGGERSFITSISQTIYKLKLGLEGYLPKIRQLINAKAAICFFPFQMK